MARLAFRVPLIGYKLSKVPESWPGQLAQAACPGQLAQDSLPRTSRGRSISTVMHKRNSAPTATERKGDYETPRVTFISLKESNRLGLSTLTVEEDANTMSDQHRGRGLPLLPGPPPRSGRSARLHQSHSSGVAFLV
jgi:hypothetical protein